MFRKSKVFRSEYMSKFMLLKANLMFIIKPKQAMQLTDHSQKPFKIYYNKSMLFQNLLHEKSTVIGPLTLSRRLNQN